MKVKELKIKKFLNNTVYIERFPKFSFSETNSKISLQTQILTPRVSLIVAKG